MQDFLVFSFKDHLSDQLTILLKFACKMTPSSPEEIDLLSLASSANSSIIFSCKAFGRSLIYNKNRTGPRTDPCEMPLLTGIQLEKESWIQTLWYLLLKKSLFQFPIIPVIPVLKILVINFECETVSKALLKSVYIMSTLFPSSNCLFHFSMQTSSCNVQDLPGTNPNWLSDNRSFCVRNFIKLSLIIFFIILQKCMSGLLDGNSEASLFHLF